MLETLTDHMKLDAQIEKVNEEIALVSGLVGACMWENAEISQVQDEYTSKYDSLAKRYEKAMARLEKLNAERADKVNRTRELRGFIDALMTSPLVLDAWDEQLWRLLGVKGNVHRDGNILFAFRNEKK